jgi:hypothetical protein
MKCESIEDCDRILEGFSELLVDDDLNETDRKKLMKKVDFYLDIRLDFMILAGATSPELELING